MDSNIKKENNVEQNNTKQKQFTKFNCSPGLASLEDMPMMGLAYL